MAHPMRGHLIANGAMRIGLIPGQLYDQILSHLERLKSIEQRRQTASFGERRQHDDDISGHFAKFDRCSPCRGT